MPSSNCDWSKYRASKIVWDNQSLVMNYPNIINYSIENIPGLPYKIRWDTSSQYLIKNPTNYSYSFWWDMTCITYDIWIAWSRDYIYACNPARAANTTRSMSKFISFRKPVSISITKELNGYSCPPENVPNNNFYLNVIYNNGTCTSTLNYRTLLFTGMDSCTYSFTIKNANLSDEPQRQIVIVDGGITYTYPITDVNSVWIENSIASKKININGRKFDLINESSIQLSCVNPIQEHCPRGTIECECSSELCCYKKVNHGYQLVKTIPKIT